jgi:hypothetical protein
MAVREQVGSERWARLVKDAQARYAVLEKVREKCSSEGKSPYQVLPLVSQTTPWATFQYWNGRVAQEASSSWESLVDRRVPPKPKKIAEAVRASAITLRRVCPEISSEEAIGQLVSQHGDAGKISRTSLNRIWHAAGLIVPTPVQEELVVEQFHGGAGLALIGAAEAETGAMLSLAEAVQDEAQLTISKQEALNPAHPAEPAGRDERGRLTAAYNRATRAGLEAGESDARWGPDFSKRIERDLGKLQVLEHRPHTVAAKLLAVGLTPLITERRGFDGLDGPFGDWLGVLGGCPYKPATLDKFLAQLAFLDVEDALWEAHASLSKRLIVRWTSKDGQPKWLQLVIYIDASQDSYWTRKYAMSGKVSRSGRVGPCLTRATITGGPGIPLLVETYAGSVSLKTELPRLLERVDAYIGEGELGRITIIDAEMSTARLLHALTTDPRRSFITVLKSPSIAKNCIPQSDWVCFRERDEVREGEVVVHGQGAPKEGVKLRVVEMRRPGRHQHSTYFAAGGSDIESLSTIDIPEVYLSRWPHQEQLFRNTRNGLGLDRTHGYGGEMVQHVAIDTKMEKAERALRRAQDREIVAGDAAKMAGVLATKAKKADKGSATNLVALTQAQSKAAKIAVERAQDDLDDINTTSREIYQRDPARENVVTALTMTTLLLIEYVLREFFVGIKIELRTFIEHFIHLPVTTITSNTEIRYQVESNPRNHERSEQVRRACEEVTRRQIRTGGKTLVFEMIEPQRKRVEVRRI